MPIQEILDQKMPSMTEWMEKIGLTNITVFRDEDNKKRDRLEILFQEIGLPYDRPERIKATDITENTPLFQKILQEKGHKQCALRLVPIDPNLPKLRQRGKTLIENLKWFKAQDLNPSDYKVEIVPHSDHVEYSATFFINDQGITGEIIPGLHWQLTQGLLEHQTINFSYKNNTWFFSNTNSPAIDIVKNSLEKIKITDIHTQENLKEKLQSEFTTDGYLKGYFEFCVWPEEGVLYIDYNRVIYQMLKNTEPPTAQNDFHDNNTTFKGVCACPGKVTGKARVINSLPAEINEGEILICKMTMVDYLPLMKKSGAIITEQGTILSHAAIVARELKKPCLVGVKNIMEKIKNGQFLEVDAVNGVIKVI